MPTIMEDNIPRCFCRLLRGIREFEMSTTKVAIDIWSFAKFVSKLSTEEDISMVRSSVNFRVLHRHRGLKK